MKVGPYESETFVAEMEETWKGLKPLYEQLHAYVRSKLLYKYDNNKVDHHFFITNRNKVIYWSQVFVSYNCHQVIWASCRTKTKMINFKDFGEEPWCSGWGRGLTIKRSWVRVPPYTGWKIVGMKFERKSGKKLTKWGKLPLIFKKRRGGVKTTFLHILRNPNDTG